MTFDGFKTLLKATLVDPREGGKGVIALNLPMQGLWMALMLMAVILSLLLSGLIQLAPLPDDEAGQILRMSPAYSSPIMFAVINWGQSVITVFVLYWISQMLGGQGELRDMLTVMIWLQVVSLVLAFALSVVTLLLPSIGAFFMLLAFFWGLWAMVGLVDAASGFDNLFKAFGVCLAALLVFTIGMTLFSGVIGGLAAGGVGNA